MDSKPITRLVGKEYSPLVIRRYAMPFLHWVAIICDANLDGLDMIINDFWLNDSDLKEDASIQDMRNIAGALTEEISVSFKGIEGIAVIFSADKLLVSSLLGDFMVHEQCRLELYALLNLSTQV